MTRILVVEDEESFSDPLSYMLQKEGYDVAVAATGTGSARRPARRARATVSAQSRSRPSTRPASPCGRCRIRQASGL